MGLFRLDLHFVNLSLGEGEDKDETALAEEGAPPASRQTVPQFLSLGQLMAEREAAGWKPDPRMALLPTGTALIRADRDSR